MKVIGLTGGIGTGKSTVSKFLAELGAVIVDADKVGHEEYKYGTKGWRKVVDAFGKDVVDSEDNIDRKKLASLVFDDPEARSRLTNIMHPLIYKRVTNRMDEYRKQGAEVIVLEIPLLIEAGWGDLVDQIWVTTAPEATVLKRLEGRRGMSHSESLARIRTQLSQEERAKHADVIINTDCSLEELRAKIKEAWEKVKEWKGGSFRKPDH